MWAPLQRRRGCSGLHRVVVISTFQHQSSFGIRSLFIETLGWWCVWALFSFFLTSFLSADCAFRVEWAVDTVLVS